MRIWRGGRRSREERRWTLLRTPNDKPPYSSCLPYAGRCAIHGTSQRMAGEGQDTQNKDDHESLLPPSERMRVGEILASVVAAAAAGERERDVVSATIPEEVSPWLSEPVFIPTCPTDWWCNSDVTGRPFRDVSRWVELWVPARWKETLLVRCSNFWQRLSFSSPKEISSCASQIAPSSKNRCSHRFLRYRKVLFCHLPGNFVSLSSSQKKSVTSWLLVLPLAATPRRRC